jgi:ribosomal protein S18 acetylase RimI-like enzyme
MENTMSPNPNTITVRRATPADASAVHTMVLEIASHANQTVAVASTREQWRDFLGRDDVVVLLAERDGTSLGYVSTQICLNLWADRDIVALDGLYVCHDARNEGVGRRLMTEIARLAAVDERIVRWEVDLDNTAAQLFYARLGASLTTKSSPAGPQIGTPRT